MDRVIIMLAFLVLFIEILVGIIIFITLFYLEGILMLKIPMLFTVMLFILCMISWTAYLFNKFL